MGTHPRPPDWKSWLARPLIAQCAHHWDFLNRAGYAQVDQRATLVRFEDMIADPRQFSAAICGKLGIDPAADAAHLARWSRRVQNSNNSNFIEAQTSGGYSRPDHRVRIDRWRENLTGDEVAEIWDITGETALAWAIPLRFASPNEPPSRKCPLWAVARTTSWIGASLDVKQPFERRA